MMNLAIAVASYGQDGETAEFLNSVGGSRIFDTILDAMETVKILRVIYTDGGKELKTCGLLHQRIPRECIGVTSLPDKPRPYACVVYEKIEAVAPHCDDRTIFWNADPDYHLNPWALSFARRIFEDNDEVDYLCLLTEPTVKGIPGWQETLCKLNGFRFVKHPSAMGGAMFVRWKSFYPRVKQFFDEHNVTGDSPGKCNAFDQQYWRWLAKWTRDERPVYMLWNGFGSLVQHCNLTSRYLKDKGPGGALNHMAAAHYDPRVNPFAWLEATRGEEAA